MLSVTDYWRKTNQKFNEVSPHMGHNGHLQTSPTINAGEGVERREPSCTVIENAHQYIH